MTMQEYLDQVREKNRAELPQALFWLVGVALPSALFLIYIAFIR